MSRKEIEFNGIFYWELEQKDFFQLFPECPKALMFENESGIDFIGTEIVLCLGKKDCLTKNPFILKTDAVLVTLSFYPPDTKRNRDDAQFVNS